jgi:hypothetical protein
VTSSDEIPAATPDDGAQERITERLIGRECSSCGAWIAYRGRGRRPRYCGASCRQRAWSVRRAAEQLGTLDGAGPQVVTEVRERVVERPVSVPVLREPTTPREWVDLLQVLAEQLDEPTSALAAQHWQHRRVEAALMAAWQALDVAHPGGLARR